MERNSIKSNKLNKLNKLNNKNLNNLNKLRINLKILNNFYELIYKNILKSINELILSIETILICKNEENGQILQLIYESLDISFLYMNCSQKSLEISLSILQRLLLYLSYNSNTVTGPTDSTTTTTEVTNTTSTENTTNTNNTTNTINMDKTVGTSTSTKISNNIAIVTNFKESNTNKDITKGKEVNNTFTTPGKGPNGINTIPRKGTNYTGTECTPGKGANYMGMESTNINTEGNIWSFKGNKDIIGTVKVSPVTVLGPTDSNGPEDTTVVPDTNNLTKCTSTGTPGKGANFTAMECTMGKGANFTAMECTMGKGANFTAMECTMGKGANFTAMECTSSNSTKGSSGTRFESQSSTTTNNLATTDSTTGTVGASTVMEKLINEIIEKQIESRLFIELTNEKLKLITNINYKNYPKNENYQINKNYQILEYKFKYHINNLINYLNQLIKESNLLITNQLILLQTIQSNLNLNKIYNKLNKL